MTGLNFRLITDPDVVADLCCVYSNFVPRKRDLTWMEWDALIAAAPPGTIGTNPERSIAALAAWRRKRERQFGVVA